MGTRQIDFKTDCNNIFTLYSIVKRIKEDLSNLKEELDLKIAELNRIETIIKKYEDIYEVKLKLEAEKNQNLEILKIKDDFEFVFNTENKYSDIVISRWASSMSNFSRFENGEAFNLVFLSVSKIEDKKYSRPSLITSKLMGFNEEKVGLILSVDQSNFVGVSSPDYQIVTKHKPTLFLLNKTKNGNVHLERNNTEIYQSRITTPGKLEQFNLNKTEKLNGEILNSDRRKVSNEIILMKSETIPEGIVIISNGYDFLLEEYLIAKKLQEKYSKYELKIKVINKGIYREKNGLLPLTVKEKQACDSKIVAFSQEDKNYNPELLDGFLEEVVLPAKYDPFFEKKLTAVINNKRNQKQIEEKPMILELVE